MASLLASASAICWTAALSSADTSIPLLCRFPFPSLSHSSPAVLSQAKQVPVAAMRAQTQASSRQSTANRAANSRANQQQARRATAAAAKIPAGAQTMLVFRDAQGKMVQQPVALVQQPGQAGAQVLATGAPISGNAPLFSNSNRAQQQPKQQQRRTSGGGNQRQGGNNGGNQQRQSGNRQSGNRQGGGRRN